MFYSILKKEAMILTSVLTLDIHAEVRLYPLRHIVDQRGCIHILRSQDVNTSSQVDYMP